MKAAVYERYGPPEVVSIKQVPKPIIKPDQVLIRVHASSVNSGDSRLRAWRIPSLVFSVLARFMIGLFKPQKTILGTSVAGVVEQVGNEVSGLSVGQRVLGSTEMNFGAHAEFAATSGKGQTQPIPDSMRFDEAETLAFGGSTAIYFLKDLANIKPNQRVLIIGASGAVGVAAVQYAKHLGAHVTAVCSGPNEELVRSLGADDVIDYTQEDYTHSSGRDQLYDAVFDTVGASSRARCKNIIRPGGTFLPAVMLFPELAQLVWTPLLAKIRKTTIITKSGVATAKPEYLKELISLASQGRFKPVIDRTYPLDEAVEAHRYVDTGRKRGSVILKMID